MDERMKKILELAVRAPSGDNCQPWEFVHEGDKVMVYNVPSRDQSLYNWGQRASYIAHGALTENIVVAATQYGLRSSVRFLEPTPGENLIAETTFYPDHLAGEDALARALSLRSTNRRPYHKEPLNPDVRDALKQAGYAYPEARAVWVEEREKIEAIAAAASVNERIVFENEALHGFLFSHINWTEEEDNEKKTGFPLKTFEVPPPAILIFKLARSWSRLKKANLFGLSRLIAKQNASVYAQSACLGAIKMRGVTEKEYFMAGRALERIWLTAAHHQLGMQVLAGVPLLAHGITHGAVTSLSPEHKELIRQAYRSIETACGAADAALALLFRIGKSDPPSAHTKRLPPVLK